MSAALTVMGSSGTHAANGRAASSYLVEAAGTRLLLDCGNGSLANLTQRMDVADLDAVVISHLHVDHFADVYGLYYALRFYAGGPRSVPVYAPAGAEAHLRQLLPDDADFAQRCRFHEVAAGDTFTVGDVRVRLFASAHPVEGLASRLEVDGTVLAYSGDSGPQPDLVDCARDADLFVCDSTWLERDRPVREGVHMTGAEAGRHAQQAGAARLLVTHVWPTHDPAEVAAEAAQTFSGTIIVAEDHQELAL